MTQLCRQCLNGWRLAESCLNVVLALNEAANLLVFSGKCCAPHKFTIVYLFRSVYHFGSFWARCGQPTLSNLYNLLNFLQELEDFNSLEASVSLRRGHNLILAFQQQNVDTVSHPVIPSSTAHQNTLHNCPSPRNPIKCAKSVVHVMTLTRMSWLDTNDSKSYCTLYLRSYPSVYRMFFGNVDVCAICYCNDSKWQWITVLVLCSDTDIYI